MSDQPKIEIPDLTPEQEDEIVARRLSSFARESWDGRLPYSVFRAIGLVTVRFTVEVAFMRPSAKSRLAPEILLTKRPPTDEDIPNQWHIPGVTVFANDPVGSSHDNDAAIERVRQEAAGTLKIVRRPIEMRTVRRVGGQPRRSEVTTQYMAPVSGKPAAGTFFDVKDVLRNPPPDGLVENHADTIERASHVYESLK